MTLIICEKDNAAKRIAAILSKNNFQTENYKKVPYYIYKDNGKDCVIVGLRGHILNLDYPKEYNQWRKVDPKELIRLNPEKQVTLKNIVTLLKKLAKEHKDAIIATDYDREGELIGVEGLDILKQGNPKIDPSRARFSSLTKNEIEDAFKKLTTIDYNLSSSAETRQLIDLAWGASLTRFVSMASNRMGKDFLSVGRVQSPTLSLIVDKEKEIKAFVKKPYWEIELQLDGKTENPVKAKHVKDRFWEKKAAEEVYARVQEAKDAVVKKVDTKDRTESPPPPFNTTSFLRAATGMGLSAARAMSIAEDLYTQGLISYPRTDNTVYPKSLNLKEILQTLAKGEFGDLAVKLLEKKTLKPTRGKKSATDHPPIHPVDLAKKSKIDNQHWKIYELVVRRFMATLADPYKNKFIEALFDVNKEDFRATGVKVTYLGWREFYTYGGNRERELPDLTKGDSLAILDSELMSKETKPPKRFTQGSLIQEMDKLGLGTKSTRHEIIQKLYDRGYIVNRPPEPTLMGFAVADALESYADPITHSNMTSRLENDMDEIASGKIKQEDVVNESQDMLEEVFSALEKNKNEIGESIKAALKEQSTIGTCPWCGHDMLITQSRWGKRFVSCSFFPQCRNSYPLPQKGKVIPLGKACEHCRSPVVQIQSRRKKPWEICVNLNCPGREKENDSQTDDQDT